MNKLKMKYDWFIIGIFLLGFILVAILVLNGNMVTIDYKCYLLIHKYIINDFMTCIFKLITFLGGTIWLISVIIICLLLIKDKKIGISVGCNIFLVYLLNILLKSVFLIPRPDSFRLIEESGYSFPSGHAMVSVAFYGLFIYYIYKFIKSKKIKIGLILLNILIILLIGFSRIYLGVHNFSDILGGYLIGIFYLLLYIKLIKKLGLVDKHEI